MKYLNGFVNVVPKLQESNDPNLNGYATRNAKKP